MKTGFTFRLLAASVGVILGLSAGSAFAANKTCLLQRATNLTRPISSKP